MRSDSFPTLTLYKLLAFLLTCSFGPRRGVTLADAVSPVQLDDGPLLEYLFGAPLVDGAVSPFSATGTGTYSHWQKVVCAMMLHYWTNFITTG